MTELSREMREANDNWWARHLAHTEDSYRREHLGGTLDDDREKLGNFENAAWIYAMYAFKFLAGELDDLAADAIERTIRAAEEALRTESYSRLYYRMKPVPGKVPGSPGSYVEDETFRPTAKEIATEKLCGRMSTLEYLHYALWFKTGQRPMELFKESVDLRKECFVLRKGADYPELLQNSVQVGDYEYASELARKKARRATAPPGSKRFVLNESYALFVVAQYGLGRKELEPYARRAIDHWHGRCLDWVHQDVDLPWWTALGWAYLRGKFFTGVTDARLLIKELRGF